MKEVIKLEPKKLISLLKINLSIGIILSIVLFVSLKIDTSFIFMICTLILLSLIIRIFYLNQNEPDSILIEENRITISYINKSFFKKQTLNTELKQLNFEVQENVLQIKQNGNIIANLRKEALIDQDWAFVLSLFPVSRSVH